MNHVRTWIGLAFTAALAGLVAFAVHRTDAADPFTPSGGPLPRYAVGATGCSGAACHGSPIRGDLPTSHWGPDLDRWKTSYEVWRLYDPHARAYRVLIDGEPGKVSAEIVRKLSGEGSKAWEDPGAWPATRIPGSRSVGRTNATRGVSCEACHGNATRYLYDHIGWGPGPEHHAKFRPAGMTELFDPAVRAETCAKCHVGAPSGDGSPFRNVSHDLIAAGHPRLNFDYATYVRALPPHWTEKDRTGEKVKARPADEIAHHWLVGRAAAAAAACDLIDTQARLAKGHISVWPDSRFDCYACHHNLQPTSFETSFRTMPSAASPVALLERAGLREELIELSGNAKLKETHAMLKARMSGVLEPEAVARDAKAAATEWHAQASAWAKGPPLTPGQIATALQDMKVRRWDDAAHGYYALRALDAARGVEGDPDLAGLRTALRLPRGDLNSPADFDPVRKPFDFRALFGKRR